MIRIARAVFPSRHMWNGCWAVRAAPRRPTSLRKWTRNRRRSWRATPGTANLAGASLSRIWRQAELPTPATARNFSAATAPRTSRGVGTKRSALRKSWPGLDPCAALQTTVELRPGAAPKSFSSWAKPKTANRLATCSCAIAQRIWNEVCAKSRALGRNSRRSTGHYSRPSMDVLLNRWLLYQTLILPRLGTRRFLPGERRLRIPRSTAGRDGAECFQARRRARTIIARCSRQFPKATCSTGGTLLRAAEFARAFPTICSGCPTP